MRETVYPSHEICVGGTTILTDYPVRDAFELDGRVIVLLDPDEYLEDPDYPKERRRGDNALRNLRAYSNSGELLWEAEFPEPADYYYKIVSRSPLWAMSFSSFRCRIDPESGRILETQFLK
jgi:hypothetical protein